MKGQSDCIILFHQQNVPRSKPNQVSDQARSMWKFELLIFNSASLSASLLTSELKGFL